MASPRRHALVLLFRFGLSLLISPLSLAGQGAPLPARASVPSRPEWGAKDRVLTHIGFNEFLPMPAAGVSISSNLSSAFGLYSVGGPSSYAATAHVPSGALLTYLELDYCDTNAAVTADVSLNLFRCSYLGTNCTSMSFLSSNTGPMGCHIVTEDLTGQGFTMDNNAYELVVLGTTGASDGDSTTSLGGVYIGYKLQISPAPGAPTFGDVPTNHPYFRAIEALAASGVTGGCGNGNFCPEKNVSRGEMAAFLARALGLHFPN